jgi:hypothetical protein
MFEVVVILPDSTVGEMYAPVYYLPSINVNDILISFTYYKNKRLKIGISSAQLTP